MSSSKRFKKLLEPSYIGKTRLRNRMIKTAQGSSIIEPGGYIGEATKAYYDYLSSGGIGLLIVESCGVEYPLGVQHPQAQFHLDDDKYIPGYGELAETVHKNGCPIFLQLMHEGPWNPTGGLTNCDARCSSVLAKQELPGPDFLATRGLSTAEVEEVIEMFIKAAARAQKAGFDGVEINGATCHLINTFFSRIFNRRDDEYGGETLENRARFMCNIVRGVKKRCGQDFTVTALVNIAEYGHKNATTVEEGVQFAKFIEDAGANAIQVRAHLYGHRGGLLHPDRLFYPELIDNLPKDLDWSHKGKGDIIPLAVAVKKVVSIPVFAACRLDPVLGEEFLEQGKIDYVGMTRRILADPQLPHKVAENRLEDIRPCLGCLWCGDLRLRNKPVKCRVNPRLGRELELLYKPVGKKKKILVIGGGPAGMTAASIAAQRGHEVTLCDKESKLGGLVPIAAMFKDVEIDDILALVKYLENQMVKAGVTVRRGKEVTSSVISDMKPDVVILAAGGIPSSIAIPGVNLKKVASVAAMHKLLKRVKRFFGIKTIAWLTKVWMPIGKQVVVIGGTIHGCELAEFLIKRGRKVAIVHDGGSLGEGMTEDDIFRFTKWLNKKGVKVMTGVKYEEINNNGLVIKNKDGEHQTIEADTFAMALPLQANTKLADSLKDTTPEFYVIGDCKTPGLMTDAIADGAIIGNMI